MPLAEADFSKQALKKSDQPVPAFSDAATFAAVRCKSAEIMSQQCGENFLTRLGRKNKKHCSLIAEDCSA
jgi:hypothetical protein